MIDLIREMCNELSSLEGKSFCVQGQMIPDTKYLCKREPHASLFITSQPIVYDAFYHLVHCGHQNGLMATTSIPCSLAGYIFHPCFIARSM